MAQKDASEKILESYNDVFSDIVNVLLFKGRKVLSEEELEDRLHGRIIRRTVRSTRSSETS